MIGFDGIGFHAVGELILQSGSPLTFEPVSRLTSGAYSPGTQLVELGLGIEWDNDDIMIWDDDSEIGWEA
jgi:hypothetical protein